MNRGTIDPRVVRAAQCKSVDTVRTFSTVNTYSTINTRLPAAQHNFGHTEEDLQGMTAAQTGQAFAQTSNGRVANTRLNNKVLSQAYAGELNKKALIDQNEMRAAIAEAAKQKKATMKRKKARKQKWLLVSLLFIGLLIAFGVFVAVASTASDDQAPNGNENDANEEEDVPVPPEDDREPNDPIVLSESPTGSPTTKAPSTSPTQSPVIVLSLSLEGFNFDRASAIVTCGLGTFFGDICLDGELFGCVNGRIEDNCVGDCSCRSSVGELRVENPSQDTREFFEKMAQMVEECSTGAVVGNEGCDNLFSFTCKDVSPLDIFIAGCVGCQCKGLIRSSIYCESPVVCSSFGNLIH